MMNISDLKDLSDPQGRTYREINNATPHGLEIGDLVNFGPDGVRMFITRLTRDCDGTPLYCLGPDPRRTIVNGYNEDYLTKVK